MNVLQQKAALALMIRLDERPDIIHCHDGHTALLPAMLREIEGYRHYFSRTGCVVTIHNAGTGYHQEVADLPFAKAVTGLPQRVIDNNLLAGAFDPLLTAAAYALLNTVSENYARELQETDDDSLTGWLGHTLVKRGFSLAGVTNGIDPADYNLKNYQALGLAAGFIPGSTSARNKAGKAACRRDLIMSLAAGRMTGLKQTGHLDWLPQLPLFTFVGRFTAQKGIDKLQAALKKLLLIQANFQILILGSGQKDEEDKLRLLARQPANSGRICLLCGFDSITATRMFAAGDFFLIPSRYEPCGLTDFQAQLFGNLPIVHAVGGLVKVRDGKTGFTYDAHDSGVLIAAMQRAINLFATEKPALARMQKAAVILIHRKYTWDKVMSRYLELYRRSNGLARNGQ
ncbi:MAG: glycogen synthase [Deltaproteobacteria bacterium]|nr:glycogen synthase [Deltaproteobacteria bacterium]